jgi:hypothetical protein
MILPIVLHFLIGQFSPSDLICLSSVPGSNHEIAPFLCSSQISANFTASASFLSLPDRIDESFDGELHGVE